MSIRKAAVAFSLSLLVAIIGLAGCGGGGDGGGGGGGGGNTAPVINSLTAAADEVWPTTATDVTVNAADQDGDSLTYVWSATGGTISGSGTTVTWTAPTADGDYIATVTVSDGRGGQVQQSVTISVLEVGPPPPPPFQ